MKQKIQVFFKFLKNDGNFYVTFKVESKPMCVDYYMLKKTIAEKFAVTNWYGYIYNPQTCKKGFMRVQSEKELILTAKNVNSARKLWTQLVKEYGFEELKGWA